MPVILATWEVEIGRIVASPGNMFERPQLNIIRLGTVVHACHPQLWQEV
jgi:hypothetical protein